MAFHLTDFVMRPSAGVSVVYHYGLNIDTASTPVPVLRKVWQEFERTHDKRLFADTKVIFDGRKNLFSTKFLLFGEVQAQSFVCHLQEGRNPKTFTINIKKAGEINMEELRLFLEGRSPCTSNCLTAIMVFDILLRNIPITVHVSFGRSFYTSDGKQPIPNAAEIWQGHYQSARPTPGKMMINLDATATAFHEGGPLPDFVTHFLGRRSIDEFRRGLSGRDRTKLIKRSKKIRVITNHRGERNITRPVKGLSPLPVNKTMFRREDGSENSVAEYFTQ